MSGAASASPASRSSTLRGLTRATKSSSATWPRSARRWSWRTGRATGTRRRSPRASRALLPAARCGPPTGPRSTRRGSATSFTTLWRCARQWCSRTRSTASTTRILCPRTWTLSASTSSRRRPPSPSRRRPSSCLRSETRCRPAIRALAGALRHVQSSSTTTPRPLFLRSACSRLPVRSACSRLLAMRSACSRLLAMCASHP
eukprot:Amastigsp_a7027_21.p3 type:complete len:202 gc:universal Amastigsp_a7027_21:616-11(-)